MLNVYEYFTSSSTVINGGTMFTLKCIVTIIGQQIQEGIVNLSKKIIMQVKYMIILMARTKIHIYI
jgi:hypothetical protein